MKLRITCAALALAAMAVAGTSPHAARSQQAPQTGRQTQQQAGQQQAAQQQDLRTHAVVLPGTDRVLQLQVTAPDEVRVGASYEFSVHVTNLSEQLVLHNVRIGPPEGEGFRIEASHIEDRQPQAEDARGQAAADQQRGQQQQQADQRQRDRQQQQDGQRQRDRQQQQAGQRQRDRQQQQAGQQQQARQQQQAGPVGAQAHDGDDWVIEQLRPGETRVIRVTASSDQEGEVATCLMIKGFTPAFCLQTRFVQPELEIVKRAPDRASLCEDFQVEYIITNSGTGDLDELVITDQLGQGLQTITGEDSLRFEVDGLEAGQVRRFAATLRPNEAGNFGSRAVARAGELEEVRSNHAATQIVQPDLRVTLTGADAQRVHEPVRYTARVTNHGEIAAEDAVLTLRHPRDLQLIRVGEVRRVETNDAQNGAAGQVSFNAAGSPREAAPQRDPTRDVAGRDAEQRQGNSQPQEAQRAEGQTSQAQTERAQAAEAQAPAAEAQNQRSAVVERREVEQRAEQADRANQGGRQAVADQDRRGQQAEQARRGQQADRADQRGMQRGQQPADRDLVDHSWEIGTLEPGDTVEVTYVARGAAGGTFRQEAIAWAPCGVGEDDQPLAVRAAAFQTVEIISLPGLMIAVVDQEDPVALEDEVVYSIIVRNQGTAPDQNVALTIELPQGLEFSSIDGTTDGEVEGRQLQLEPIDELGPGEEARWTLRAMARQEGQVTLTVNMDSDGLRQSVQSEEPTQLFETTVGARQQDQPQQRQQRQRQRQQPEQP